jgi:hypothetical protein
MSKYGKFKLGLEAHKYAVKHLKDQKVLEINAYILSSILTLATFLLLLRIVFVKDKGFLLFMVVLLLAANSLAVCVSNLQYKINSLLAETLWERNQSQIDKLITEYLWLIFSAYALLNLAHWIFAMKYWSIGLRSEEIKSKTTR